jgi:hypothetical protein
MDIWNEIFNPNPIRCIINGKIHYKDGSTEIACPYARFKQHLKSSFPQVIQIKIMEGEEVLQTVKSVHRLHKYYIHKGDHMIITSKGGMEKIIKIPNLHSF